MVLRLGHCLLSHRPGGPFRWVAAHHPSNDSILVLTGCEIIGRSYRIESVVRWRNMRQRQRRVEEGLLLRSRAQHPHHAVHGNLYLLHETMMYPSARMDCVSSVSAFSTGLSAYSSMSLFCLSCSRKILLNGWQIRHVNLSQQALVNPLYSSRINRRVRRSSLDQFPQLESGGAFVAHTHAVAASFGRSTLLDGLKSHDWNYSSGVTSAPVNIRKARQKVKIELKLYATRAVLCYIVKLVDQLLVW
jgi:hypothetical protein